MSEHIDQHLNPEEIEQWALGLLPAARALHLAECPPCLATAERERKLFRDLIQLERFAPSAGFAEKVIAGVRIATPSGRFERQ
jgi:hypothetical protein